MQRRPLARPYARRSGSARAEKRFFSQGWAFFWFFSQVRDGGAPRRRPVCVLRRQAASRSEHAPRLGQPSLADSPPQARFAVRPGAARRAFAQARGSAAQAACAHPWPAVRILRSGRRTGDSLLPLLPITEAPMARSGREPCPDGRGPRRARHGWRAPESGQEALTEGKAAPGRQDTAPFRSLADGLSIQLATGFPGAISPPSAPVPCPWSRART
ncbi:hypothetical protein SAMN06296416_1203 [Pseudoxanthomonas wuyuanensis]|uniref:Uncharacterized protein n=1 Tax=Pseudoxanthomonas wuyuanensis TaxID=1073196 RepID=A0A286DH22_9GAMM|nr:hypothetical protein SAMN06296416_1203 [Pseudoxanthomonas wuyuanensis]